MTSRETLRELLIFSLLLAFGIVGRWAQPQWNFTPLAAVAAMGGYCFRGWLPAVLLPLSVLLVSDMLVLPHDNLIAQGSVYAMTVIPIALGRAARRNEGWRQAACWGLCGFAPATTFFFVTNFAVWASKSLYAPTLAGLLECYERGLPFYRWMLAGDLCYVGLMAACVSAAHVLQARTQSRAVAISRRCR